jgi:hypothetical protein
LQSQIRKRSLARANYIFFAMFVIPQLRSNPHLLASDAWENVLERVTNLVFVSIYGRTIEMPISRYCGAFDRACHLGG